MPTGPRVAVVGAGLAGLAAAWRLRQSGVNPVVFEAEPVPGGRSRSAAERGAIRDLGAWSFTPGSSLSVLARELGLADEQIDVAATVGRSAGGRLRIAPLARPLLLVGRGVLGPAEAWHAARARGLARRPARPPADEPAATWAARHFPAAFQASLLEPLAGLFFLQDLDTLSRDALLGTLGYLGQVRLRAFRSGMGALAAALAQRVPVQCARRVDQVAPRPDGVHVAAAGWAGEFAAAVVATPLPEARRLLGALWPAAGAGAEPAYAPALAVHLLLRGAWPLAALMVLPPAGGPDRLGCGFTMGRAQHPGRVPSGHELVTFYAAPGQVARLAALPDSRLIAAFAGELERWLPGRGRLVEAAWVHRWEHGAACAEVNGPARMAALADRLARLSRAHPIWLAGDYLGQSSVDGAVRSGLAAADAAAAHLAQRT